MKTLFLLMVLPVFAQASECVRYELFGKVKTLKGEYELVVHEGTRSERKFRFHHKDIPKLAPYAEKTLSGEFILPEADPVTGTKVVEVTKVDFAVPDPLQHKRGLVKLGPVKCPKID